MTDRVTGTCCTKYYTRKFPEEPLEICLGKLSNFCFFYPSSHGNSSVDVLQSQRADRMGECLFPSVSGMGWLVPAWGSPLYGTSDDCVVGPSSYAGCD